MRRRVILLAALALVSTPIQAQAPDSIAFQGYLTNSTGEPINSAGVGVTFKLYKGSTVVWTEPQVVDVHDGIFDVILGSVTPLDTVVFDVPIELGVKLDGEASEISPRTPLSAVPYALSSTSLTSGIPRIISHQGLLTDSGGAPLPDDSVTLHFALYEQPSAVSSVWTESQTVWTSGGVFGVYLGSTDSLDIPFDRPYWLGLQVGENPEITPRSPLTAAPYALNPPPNELCDGQDNDFDGVVDDGYPNLGDPCIVGVGACQRPGTFVCSDDKLGTECDAEAVSPTPEVCDGLDNDCDGLADEDFADLGEDCVVGQGACEAWGVKVCNNSTTTCSATPGAPTSETCDGIDNDCDGTADEGVIPPLCPEQLGLCADSRQICRYGEYLGCYTDDGSVIINTYGPDYQTEEDRCDGQDNDCDGTVDEGC